MHTFFLFFLFFYFFTFLFFCFFIFLGWARPSQPGPAIGPIQWPSWAKEEEARVK
jgi:hypothetical protein